MEKAGKEFENLVAWVQKCLHKHATVTPNAKLRDKDTRRLRQIDVLIELHDGPTKVSVIVEARDHGRPVGVQYVEEVSSKRVSVGADAACIVSKTGFYGTALKKAAANKIRTLTLEEALQGDWSGWLKTRNLVVVEKHWGGHLVVLMFEEPSKAPIELHRDFVAQLQDDLSARVILNSNKEPTFSLEDLVTSIFRQSDTQSLYAGLDVENPRERRSFAAVCDFRPKIFVLGVDNELHKIDAVRVVLDVWRDFKSFPFSLRRYQSTDSESSIAEMVEAEVEIHGKAFKIGLLAEHAGQVVPQGSQVAIRVQPRDEQSKVGNVSVKWVNADSETSDDE